MDALSMAQVTFGTRPMLAFEEIELSLLAIFTAGKLRRLLMPAG
jgi:hypothetical protein